MKNVLSGDWVVLWRLALCLYLTLAITTSVVARVSPDPPNVRAIVLSPRSVEVTWNQSILANVTGYLISYTTIVSYTGGGNVTVNDGNITSTIISNLEENTPYTFTVQSIVNNTALSNGNDDVSVTWSDVPGLPLNVIATPVLPNSLLVSWIPPQEVDRNGIITDYRIQYVRVGESIVNIEIATETTAILSQLIPYTTYSLEVAAASVNGSGPFSVSVVQVTGPEQVTIVSTPAGTPVSGLNNTYDYPILSSVALECMVVPSTSTAITYQWSTGGCYTNFNYNGGVAGCFPHGQTSQSVTDSDLTAEDAGTVTCTVTISGVDYTSEPMTLRISDIAITVPIFSNDQIASANRIADYSLVTVVTASSVGLIARCVSGLGPANNSDNTALGGWYFNGAQLPDAPQCTGPVIQPRATNITNFAGVIDLFQCGIFDTSVEGVYSCMILNSSLIEQTMRLGVYFLGRTAPLVDTPPLSSTTIAAGSNLTLSCTSRGSPPDTFTWMRDSDLIVQSTSITTVTHTDTSAVFRADLTINFATARDTGIYMCTVANPIGTDSATITVNVIDVPNQVPNFLATRTVLSPSVQTITLTWDMPFDNFDPIVSYEIDNCKREATVLPPQCSSIGNISLFPNVTEHTTNVTTNALYQFEITAQNGIGESVGSFVTVLEPREPQQQPSFTSIRTVHNPPASLNVFWNAPELNTTFEAPITGYEVNFSIADTTVFVINNTGPETSLLQTGLIPNTEYEVVVTALNLIGRGPTSAPIDFLSGDDIPGPPSSLDIPDVGDEPDMFTVIWSPPSQPNGVIIDYEIQYKISTDETFMSLTTTDTMITLTSLVTDVEYTIRVRARNLAGSGNFTDELTMFNVLSVQFAELIPTSKNIIDGENANFTCELVGGSNNISIIVEWSITYRNGTITNISGNNSNFILLSSNNVLVIVRASALEFNRATIICDGGHNFTGLSANLNVNPLGSCNIENGRCEESCFVQVLAKRIIPDDDDDSPLCSCPQNETLVNGRECLSQFQYFKLYDEIYENASTFIHHPLYHPDPFQISCQNDENTIQNTGSWRIVTSEANVSIPFNSQGTVTTTFTIDGVDVSVDVLGRLPIGNGSIATLTMSQAIAGVISCETSDFDISLRIVTGGGASLEVSMPVRQYGSRSPFTITADAFYVNIFGRTISAMASTQTFFLEYRSESLTLPVEYVVIDNRTINATAPQDFFNTYNATQNTSSFELLYLPPNGPSASVSFSLEYFDVHGVIELSGHDFFAVGEDLLLKCNTTPPDLPVAWERYTVNTIGFVNLADDPRSSFNPPASKTTANLTNLNAGDAGDYECFSTIPQLANVRRRANDITIFSDTLTTAALLQNDQIFLLNGRQFYTETTGTTVKISCVGLLQDSDVMFTHSRVDLTSSTSLADNDISLSQDDERIQIVFHNLTVDLNGNLSCQSRMSGRTESVLIGATASGILAVPLITTPLEVLVGETAVFSYLIVLTNFSLNVTDTIFVVSNSLNSMPPNVTLVDRGEEIYEFSIPSVSESMNGLQFTLETMDGRVVSPLTTLQVTEVIVTAVHEVPVFALPNSAVRLDCTIVVPPMSSPPNITLNWWYFLDDQSNISNVMARDRPVRFDPEDLRHSLILENVALEDAGSYACSIDNTIRDSGIIVLVVVEEPITIFTSFDAPLLDGVIINDVDSLRSGGLVVPGPMPPGDEGLNEGNVPLTPITLVCATVQGYEDPFWTITNNDIIQNPITNQMVEISNGSDVATLLSLQRSRYLTLLAISSNSLFPDELNGTYTCQTPNNFFATSVVLTNTNPYLIAISPPIVEVDFFGDISLIFQAAFSSDGINNLTPNLIVEQRDTNGVSVTNHSTVQDKRNSQIFSVTLRKAGGNLAGSYSAFLPLFPKDQVTVNLTVILPTLTATNDNVTVLSSQSVTLECLPSNSSLAVTWYFAMDDFFIPLLNTELKRNIRFPRRIISKFPYHQITLDQVEVADSGIYQCRIQLEDSIAQNITLTVLPACHGPTLSHGLLWPATAVNDTAMLQCSDINTQNNPLFRLGPCATRTCLEGFNGEEGVWDDVDTSNCTTSANLPFAVYSTYLLNNIKNDINQNVPQIIAEFQEQFNNATVSLMLHEGETFQGIYQIIPAVFTITSDVVPLSFDLVTATILDNYNHYTSFEEFSETEEPPGVAAMTPNDTCSCEVFSGENTESLRIPGVETSLLVTQGDVCIGVAGPCNCSATDCMCNAPFYSGNGTLCGQDSDQDGQPNNELDCTSDSCQQDVCPFIYNPDQNPNDCTSNIPGGCPLEIDPEFGIQWPSSVANNSVTNACNNGSGMATRFCNSDGIWQRPIVTECNSFEYVALRQQASTLAVLLNDPDTSVETANTIAMELATVTASVDNTSILPLDLDSAIFVLDVVLDVVNVNPDLLQEEGFVDNVATTFDNLLSPSNEPGYDQADRNQSQMVLQNSETFAIALANSTGGNVTIIRSNIVIAAEQRNISEINDSLIFPSQDLLDKMPDSFIGASNSFIIIPPSLIKERAINSITPIANIFYQNLESFLPSDLDDTGSRPMAVSLLLSSQVTETANNISGDPVVILFQYSTENVTDTTNQRCAFWDFTLNSGKGGWSTSGVTTVIINDTFANCTSTHLTSFAVLVDVSGTQISGAESTALSIVTYVGCGISLFCLLIAIILLLVFRSIFKGIHNFIHLNLAIALFLALAVFVSAIEPASDSRVGCKVVAALLHYFFTCVFTWMLCEGIMLYFLLVKVFNTGLGKNKLFYLAIGWGIPVPIVAIAAGIAHDQYGTIDYCWISTGREAIWAFVGPMLAIITVNVFFLFMALRALFKSKKRTLSVDKNTNADIVKAILKATVILLPLLGLTWVFGLLAINDNTTVFAWIFTILNSLQGMFILIFHVLKNEKMLAKMKSILRCCKDDYKVTSTGHSSSTGFTGTRKKSSAVASSLQNDVAELHNVTEKPSFAKLNSSDLIESTHFENNGTFKPYTTTEDEAVPKTTAADIPDNTNTSIYVEDDDMYNPNNSKDDTDSTDNLDHENESAMDLGPVLALMPDIVTFEVATGNSKEDVTVSCSHEHNATPTTYKEPNEDSTTGNDNAASDSNNINTEE